MTAATTTEPTITTYLVAAAAFLNRTGLDVYSAKANEIDSNIELHVQHHCPAAVESILHVADLLYANRFEVHGSVPYLHVGVFGTIDGLSTRAAWCIDAGAETDLLLAAFPAAVDGRYTSDEIGQLRELAAVSG